MALKKCRECGHQVSSKANQCPNCGIKNPVKSELRVIGWTIVVLVIGLFMLDFLLDNNGDSDNYESGKEANGFSEISLNVREGPSTDYNIITALQPGETVYFLKDSLGWKLVRLVEREEDITGWASGDYLSDISEYNDWEELQQERVNQQQQRQRQATISVGDEVNLKHDSAPQLLAINDDAWDKMTEALHAGDRRGLIQLLITGEVYSLENVNKVLVLDIGFTSYKVRIIEGENEGVAGWVYREILTGE